MASKPTDGPGLITFSTGMMRGCTNNHMLACILGHELAHLLDDHIYQRVIAAKDHTKEEMDEMFQQQEFIADEIGCHMAAKAGYDPRGRLQVLQMYQGMESRRYNGKARPLKPVGERTHPPVYINTALFLVIANKS